MVGLRSTSSPSGAARPVCPRRGSGSASRRAGGAWVESRKWFQGCVQSEAGTAGEACPGTLTPSQRIPGRPRSNHWPPLLAGMESTSAPYPQPPATLLGLPSSLLNSRVSALLFSESQHSPRTKPNSSVSPACTGVQDAITSREGIICRTAHADPSFLPRASPALGRGPRLVLLIKTH